MKRKSYLISTLLLSTLFGQVQEHSYVPCKPLDEMAAYYGALAKASKRADVFDWDAHYYNIELDIDIASELIYGNVEVHLTSDVDNLESVQLDFVSGMTVDAVTMNGATFNHYSDILSIALDGSYDIGESLVVGIEYHGHPEESGFQSFSFDHQNNNSSLPPIVSTLSEPFGARTWWPCKDVPTDKADSVRVSMTADAAYSAVSNGLLISETDNLDGTKTTIWEHKYPIAPYLVFISITDYSYWSDMHYFADGDSMPLEYWIYPPNATEAVVDDWNLTGNMIEIFSNLYGKYPFSDEKYGMAEFGWGGSMEHQTCSSMGWYPESTIAHELAHQWWGDLVTCSNFHHIWINEGFATYSEALYWGAKNGEAAYHDWMAVLNTPVNSTVYRPDTSSVGAIFSSSMVYHKGAWVLHMLRHVLGDETFFASLLAYRDTYQFKTASTESFQGAVEAVWGQDLEWFFDQWIYGIGRPVYRWWWSTTPEDEFGHSQLTIHVDQLQNNSWPTYKMPIDIKVSNGSNEQTLVIWDSLRTQEFTLEMDFVPTSVSFDEDQWIFKSSEHVASIAGRLQPGSFKLQAAYPNPFNGTVTIPYTAGTDFKGTINIYDIQGREVYSKYLQHQMPAEYKIVWDGRNNRGISLGSGVYIVQISTARSGMLSQKISILK